MKTKEKKEFVAQAVGEAFPYMAGATAATLLTGTPAGAFGVGFAVEGENAYQEAINSGATEEQANMERLIVGTLNGAIEQLQVGGLLKGGKKAAQPIIEAAKDKALKKIARAGTKATIEWVKTSISEGLEEALQEAVSMTAPVLHGQELPSPQEYLERAGKAGLGGMVAGGILGGAGAIAQSGKPQNIQFEKIEKSDSKTENVTDAFSVPGAAKMGAAGVYELSKSKPAAEAAHVVPAEVLAEYHDLTKPDQSGTVTDMTKEQASRDIAPQDTAGGKGEKQPWEMTRDEYESLTDVEHGTTQDSDAESIRENGLEVRPARNPEAFPLPPSAFILPKGSKQTPVLFSNILHGKLSRNAKILREGTAEFRRVAKGIKNPGTVNAGEVGFRALDKGYDIVAFKREDVGWMVLNPSAVEFRSHKNIVRQAVEQGKPVPANVLADYPDLQSSFNPPAAKEGGTSSSIGKPVLAAVNEIDRKEIKVSLEPQSGT